MNGVTTKEWLTQWGYIPIPKVFPTVIAEIVAEKACDIECPLHGLKAKAIGFKVDRYDSLLSVMLDMNEHVGRVNTILLGENKINLLHFDTSFRADKRAWCVIDKKIEETLTRMARGYYLEYTPENIEKYGTKEEVPWFWKMLEKPTEVN